MTDRTVTVREADLEWVLGDVPASLWRDQAGRLRAALDALGPEQCGHPSAHHPDIGPAFRCVLPKGHHACSTACCNRLVNDPVHCDGHMPPADVWAES